MLTGTLPVDRDFSTTRSTGSFFIVLTSDLGGIILLLAPQGG